MHLIKAIPIVRGVGADLLSYWTPGAAPLGAVIRVPLRKRTVGALVISSQPAAEAKAEIKSADFEVKKVEKTEARQLVSPEFFQAAEESARYHAASVGSTLFELLPASILADYEKLPEAKPAGKRRLSHHEPYVLQKGDDDRYGHYKSLVRERFARKESVFMMMPTAEDIKKAFSYFEKGIETYTYIFHSGLSKGEVSKRWKACVEDPHPVVIVATGGFLAIPRADIGLVIVERENSRAYKLPSRPFLDLRYVAERFARAKGADLIFGDSNLRVETLWREEEGALVDYAPLSMRSLSTSRDELVDMKKYKDAGKEFRVLSDELLSVVAKNREESGHMFVLSGRKGLAPHTVCADCETVLLCDKCSDVPLVLHSKKGGDPASDDNRFYLCNRCGKRFDAHTVCRACGSWRLRTLGIGTERVAHEISVAIPDAKVFLLDKTTASTHKKALEIAEKWYASPGGILVGTELALLYVDREIDYSAVASIDSLFSLPDFRIHEKAFSMIIRMRTMARKQFILQTRSPEIPAIAFGAKGNIIDFYRQEIDARRSADFPPFTTFIKVSYAGDKPDVMVAMDDLKVKLAGYEVDIFPAFIATVRGDFVMHALVKLRAGAWPNDDLLDRLRALPPSYAVNVDPDTIL
ncbi:MAG: hypothetical protein Q8L64_05140 [bacterium]|nr:hypothetical protein [bacterium]